MFIQITNLKQDVPLHIEGKLAESWVQNAVKDIGFDVTAFNLSVDVEKKGEFIQVSGLFTGIITLECVRCLSNYVYDLNEGFRVFLYQENNILQGDGGELELSGQDLEFTLIKGEKIDLSELVREQLILLLPDYPLCKKEDCNTNQKCSSTCNNCNCEEKPFSQLKNLKFNH